MTEWYIRNPETTSNSNLQPLTFEQSGQGVLFDIEHFGAEHLGTDYKILVGHWLEDGSWKDDASLRKQYVRYTDKLIGRLDGTLEDEQPFDVAIFLDKSARPVAWLVRALWELLAREKGTDFKEQRVPPMPEMYFLNIDREQWLPTVDPMRTGILNMKAVPEEAINSLRGIFQNVEADASASTSLDDKRILIIDEVSVTGSTLRIAQKLLQRAIPSASFDTAHWMMPGMFNDRNGSRNNDIPVWYKQHSSRGRGVADRDLRRSEKSKSKRQRMGKWFLSTVFDEPDGDSIQLRNEILQLARDTEDGLVKYQPAATRDDIDARLEWFSERKNS